MHSPTFPSSPLAIIVWTPAALALQAVTLAVMSLTRRLGRPRRIALYALLLAGSTMVWGPALLPTGRLKEQVRHLLLPTVSVLVLADLLLRQVPSSGSARIGVYAGLVELTEAAGFLFSNPSRLRTTRATWGTLLLTAPDGTTLVAREAVVAALDEPGPDPGGRGPDQSRRD